MTVYPAGGWLPEKAKFSAQRQDQGQDFVTNWCGIVQAPGDGVCVNILSDRPFPNGFGPCYPVVTITSGPFRGHTWYIGHCTSLVRPGQRFKFGRPLARADQGMPSQIGIHVPGDGGWVELGEAPNGLPGAFDSHHWYHDLVMRRVERNVPWWKINPRDWRKHWVTHRRRR